LCIGCYTTSLPSYILFTYMLANFCLLTVILWWARIVGASHDLWPFSICLCLPSLLSLYWYLDHSKMLLAGRWCWTVCRSLALHSLMSFLTRGPLRHSSGEVRDKAEQLIISLYQDVGAPVRQYLSNADENTRKSLLYKQLFKAFDHYDTLRQVCIKRVYSLFIKL